MIYHSSRFSSWQRNISAALLAVFFLTSTVFAQQAAVAPAPALSSAEQQAVNKLKVETIKDVVTTLSSDEMEGRGTAQPGGDKAAAYIADRFQKLGLKPLGEKDTYYQPIEFKDKIFQPETSITVGNQTLKMGPDFFVAPPYSGDKTVGGGLVFVAYGLTIPTPKRNDLAGIDVNGKVVVLMEGPPKNISKESWKNVHAQIEVLQNLIKMRAAAIILVEQEDKEHPYSEVADSASS